MSLLYLYNGKLLVRDGKLASNQNCCCTNPCGSSTCGTIYCSDTLFDSVECNRAGVYVHTITIPNEYSLPVPINIRGLVDDDLLINGQSITLDLLYDPGPYPDTNGEGCVGAHYIGIKPFPGDPGYPTIYQDIHNDRPNNQKGIIFLCNDRSFEISLRDTVGGYATIDITICLDPYNTQNVCLPPNIEGSCVYQACNCVCPSAYPPGNIAGPEEAGAPFPMVNITFNGVTNTLSTCGGWMFPQDWAWCSVAYVGPKALAASFVNAYYLPNFGNRTTLRIEATSFTQSLGNTCSETGYPYDMSIGESKKWIYEYSLNEKRCPTGSPTLVSIESTDTTEECGKMIEGCCEENPMSCCDESCFGILPAPTLSLVNHEICCCQNTSPKLWVTVNGEEKGLKLCNDSAQWTHCLTDHSSNITIVNTYYSYEGPGEIGLFVTIDSGYVSYNMGSCGGYFPSAGKQWSYRYNLNEYGCPTGEPILQSETSTDTTSQCDEPGACCDETCFGTIYTASLSLLP